MPATSPHASFRPLDTTLTVVSPENIAFEFRLAGPATRAAAFILDSVIIAMIAFGMFLATIAAAGMVYADAFEAFFGIFLVGLFFLWWGYGPVCEVLANGRTIGKSAMGLRVVSQTGLSINPSQAILRNLIRLVDIAPPFFPGVVSMAFSGRLQRLGDLAAGTVVVRDRSGRAPRPPRVEAGEAASLVPAGFRAGPALVEALAAHVGRRADLAPARRGELAGVAAARLCAAWGIPAPPDPDALVCAVYERAIADDAGERR